MSRHLPGPALLALGLFVGGVAAAAVAASPPDPLPPGRAINWRSAGVPGGVPRRTTVCATVAAGATRSQLQQALDRCPPGQVVRLAAGRYTIDDTLTVPDGVVLRGEGPDRTQLRAAGEGDALIRFGDGSVPRAEHSVPIDGEAPAGARRLVLRTAEGVGPGMLLLVTQLNEPGLVSITTTNGTCHWCDGSDAWKGQRALGQIVVVTGRQGREVSIDPPLYARYHRAPLATPFEPGATGTGVEDLEVVMTDSGYVANFRMEGTVGSWIRGVRSRYTDGDHVQVLWGLRNEIRDSQFLDAFRHTPGQTDADILLAHKTTATRVENNLLLRLHQSVMLNWGAAGNVVAYNHIEGNYDDHGVNTLFGGLNVHGAHPMFNLWEGNDAPKLDADFFWGSSSHNVAFRNWFRGTTLIERRDPRDGSMRRYWATQALAAVDLAQTVRHYSLVGNLIGSERQKETGRWIPRVVAPERRRYYTAGHQYGYAFGYAGPGDEGDDPGNNPLAFTTAFIHGDHDLVAGRTQWHPARGPQPLPASLSQAAKPAWFGDLPWPPFGPAAEPPHAVLRGRLPAQVCFERGRMPDCLR